MHDPMPRLVVALAALLPFVTASHASDLRHLLGDKTAIQCYESGNDVRCRELSTGRDWKVFSRKGRTYENWAGSLNRDGTKLAVMDGTQRVVINLDGTRRQEITRPGGAGSGLLWRDTRGADWVYYIGEPINKSQTGTTWRVQIDRGTNAPVESTREKLVDFQFHGGVNGSGRFLGTTFRNAYVYDVTKKKRSRPLVETQTCVSTMNPGPEPRMFYELDPSHHTIVISEWNKRTDTSRHIWRYHDGRSEIFGQWSSTDPGYAVIQKGDSEELWLVKLQVDTRGSGDNSGRYEQAPMGISHYVGRLWVSEHRDDKRFPAQK